MASAIAMVAVLAIVAIVIDLGYAKQYRRLSQNSADAAALAAAQDLDGTAAKTTVALATAKSWAQKNDPNLTAATWAGCVDPDALPYRPDPGNTNRPYIRHKGADSAQTCMFNLMCDAVHTLR